MPRRARFVLGFIVVVVMLTSSTHSAVVAQNHTLTHVVHPGETLLDLGLFYDVSPVEIANLNGIETSLRIGAGQQLDIPVSFYIPPKPGNDGPVVYIVQRGDTLFRIATRYNVSMSTLAIVNNIMSVDRIYVGQKLTIPVDADGNIIELDGPVPESGDSPFPKSNAPTPTMSKGKQIIIVLSQQRVYAFEDGILIRQFLVSTGLPATPTVQGSFKIHRKVETRHMRGPGYDLPNVPWVMYFYAGYALHGTYWHNNFGSPMSHGCVNMRTPEAEWLYRWAPVGTPVLVISSV